MSSLPSNDADVLIVGAGLAGLRCAQLLSRQGLRVVLIESKDKVGGRLSSFRVDDYVLDEGFQLINPSYPELISSGVLQDFDLRTFEAALHFHSSNGSYQLSDPRRHPIEALVGLSKSPLSLSDAVRTGSLFISSYVRSAKRIGRRPDATTYDGLVAWGISTKAIDSVLQPFLRGTLLSDDLEPSFNFTRLVLKSFVKASPGTHPDGIAALPQAFIKDLSDTQIIYNCTVTSVAPNSVQTNDKVYRARHVVVATDPTSVQSLVPGLDITTRPQTTWWWSVPKLANSSSLRIDLDDRISSGALDISSVAPERAPSGRSLVATPANIGNASASEEARVRASVAKLYEMAIADVSLVAVTEVAHALPRAVSQAGRQVLESASGLVFAGDYTTTPSIQGALKSGAMAARRILQRHKGEELLGLDSNQEPND